MCCLLRNLWRASLTAEESFSDVSVDLSALDHLRWGPLRRVKRVKRVKRVTSVDKERALPHLGGWMISKRSSQYLCTAIAIQNWWHTGSRCVAMGFLLFIPESQLHRRPPHNPGPDYVISPGVSAPSFRRSLSVSFPAKAFISLRYELNSFLCAAALCGTSWKRWTAPHCSLATASQSLHPCTTQSLLCKFLPSFSPTAARRSRLRLWTEARPSVSWSAVIGGDTYPAALRLAGGLFDGVICLVLRRLVYHDSQAL